MTLLAVHACATLSLVGLIWTVQLVHYPLFAEVRSGFAAYHERHCARIAWVVGPLMGTEALTALLLLVERPPGVPLAWAVLGAALVTAVWLATALLSVPLHARLGRGYDAAAIARLVRTNWLRTLLWSGRGLLVTAMVLRAAG